MENSFISLFNRLDNTAKLLLCGAVALILLPPVLSVERHQDVKLPHYSSFSTGDTNPAIYLQTFDADDVVCLNWFHRSGTSYSLYCTIKRGNKLYDNGGSKCGYILVKSDGSIVIRGWAEANGHYYGVDGAKAEVQKKHANMSENFTSKTNPSSPPESINSKGPKIKRRRLPSK